MKTKTFFLLLSGIVIALQTLSAGQATIKGKISDAEDQTPIGYASIMLMKQDSTLITGITGEQDGCFSISDNNEKNCLLAISYLGYQTSYLSIDEASKDLYFEIRLQPSSIILNETTVTAKRIINKPDRKTILPSPTLIKSSVDGLDLLKKLQLPRIMVDPINNEVSESGYGEVQLRINGVQVTSAEITSLHPEDIIRIEYHDDPGVRYGNAAAVIDYITRRNESGGNIRGSFMNNIGGNKTSADDIVSAKFNHKKSEFSINASYQQRKQDWTREYDEIFVYPESELHRLEVGEPTTFNKKRLYSNLNYSLTEKDSYFFNAQFRYNYYDFPNAFEDRRGKIYIPGSDIPLSIYDHSTEKTNSPALDLYYQRNLKNDQLLIFNVVGTYMDSEYTRMYLEQSGDIIETDIISDIAGKKYSLIAEGIYERKLGPGKLTGGLKHIQSYTENNYTGTTVADISMKQSESNIYAEYQIKTDKWGYMANITGTRFYYTQDNNNIEQYVLQPSARITFNPNNDLYFRYRINLRNNTPSLSYLNDVEQIIDPLQVRRGNPDLKSFLSLDQSFSAGYNKGIWGVDLLIGYDRQFDPIMESVLYEDGGFVRTYDNQKSFQNFGAEITLKLKPWKDHVTLSVTPKINRFISKGNDYLHTYTMKELRVNLDLSYKNYIAGFTTITPYRYMYGEQLSLSDQMYTITVGYKRANWSLMLGALSPFTKNYETKNENWSALNPVKSEIHTTNMTQMFFVKGNININFGKQFKNAAKRVNNSDNETGVMQGTKN